MYKRILLKLSGEALSAPDFPFSTEMLEKIALQVKEIREMGVDVGIVVGGGNICRGRIFEELGFDRVKADYAGMLATVINAIMFAAELNKVGVKALPMSAVKAQNVLDFDKDEANRLMDEGNVLVFGGGYGLPYYSTDTGSAQRAMDIGADMMLMAKSGNCSRRAKCHPITNTAPIGLRSTRSDLFTLLTLETIFFYHNQNQNNNENS